MVVYLFHGIVFWICGIGLYHRGFVFYGRKLICIDTCIDQAHTITHQVDNSVPISRNRVFTSLHPWSRCYELAFEIDSCLSDASRGLLRNGAQIFLNGLTQEKGLIWLLWKHRNGSQIRQRRFGFRVSVSFRTRSQIAQQKTTECDGLMKNCVSQLKQEVTFQTLTRSFS